MRRLHLPFFDLAGYRPAHVLPDLSSALTITFLAIPQGIAYATVAELPPAMGLYAAAIPTIVGALMRSSRDVISGPSNAISLLVGGALAAVAVAHEGVDPVVAATTLAVMVGVMQMAAGALKLGALVDFISRPVVLGYISGAALLIAVGQLHNVTGSPGGQGQLVPRLTAWLEGIRAARGLPVAMAMGTLALIVGLRRINRRLPGAMIALAVATALTWALDLRGEGLRVVADLSPVPRGMPPLTLPDLSLVVILLPAAFAASVLSLVESTAVARAIAARTGQRLSSTYEFIGQGAANLAAGFTGGYPVSGSLSRSVLNEQSSSVSRLAGAYCGVLLLLVPPLFAEACNLIPTAALAGLLLVVAWNLVDWARINILMRATWGDRVAFTATVIGTWTLPLDQAIYLGVGLSLVSVLRQVRQVGVHVSGEVEGATIVTLKGRLFFGVEEVIREGTAEVVADTASEVVVMWLGGAPGMDVSVGTLLVEISAQLQAQGRSLHVAGISRPAAEVLHRAGIAARLGLDHVHPMERLMAHGVDTAPALARHLLDGPR